MSTQREKANMHFLLFNFFIHERSTQSSQSAKEIAMINHHTQEISINITKVQRMLTFPSAQHMYSLCICTYFLKY